MAERRPTIHDVAHHAGVAVKTVSRVLNHERGVSTAMRDRVHASMRALDFRPNAAARVLRRKVTRSIGFVCEDISEPVQARLARAIEMVATRHDCTMTVSLTHHDPSLEGTVIESLVSRQVDGLILWPTGHHSRYLHRLVSTLPIVCVDRPIERVETDSVFCDNQRGAAEATNFLISRSHRRIAFVGDQPDLATQIERLEGYQRQLTASDITYDPQLVFQRQQDAEPLRQQLRHWQSMRQPPTAVFSASSLSTTALVRAAPDDALEVVGFDSFPLDDVVRGGLTVINQDVEAIGHAAADTLFRRIAGDQAGLTKIRVAPTLIDRTSLPPRLAAK